MRAFSTLAIAAVFTLSAVQAVLAAVSNFAPKVTDYLSTIQAKKPTFDKVAIATGLIRHTIENLDTETNTLDTCLVASTPSTNLAQINGYVTQIVTAFNGAKRTYNSIA